MGIQLTDLLRPFSSEMWVCVGVSFLVMSLVTWLVARLSPYQRLALDADQGMGVANSFWFAFSGLCHMSPHPVVPKVYK